MMRVVHQHTHMYSFIKLDVFMVFRGDYKMLSKNATWEISVIGIKLVLLILFFVGALHVMEKVRIIQSDNICKISTA